MSKITSVLMIGVGGQGIVLAGNVLSRAALNAGFDVKKSEIHGMAQRGGSVISHVRYGDKVFSSSIPAGGADYILSFEKMEYLRYMNYVSDETALIVSSRRMFPPTVSLGKESYPDVLTETEKEKFKRAVEVDAEKAALDAGNVKTAGIVVLGVLSRFTSIDLSFWEDAIKGSVPSKVLDANLKAFELGKSLVE